MSPRLAALALAFALLGPGHCPDANAAERVTRIDFDVTWGGAPIASATDVDVSDARLFVHDVRLVDDAGREHAARLVPDAHLQTDRVALLDLTHGDAHLVVRARYGAEHFVALRFVVGVPFEANHANPATAALPLAIGSMSWGWQGGYKFLRVEGRRGGAPFRVHVGSTGCQGTFGHVTRCARPNRAEIEVRGVTRVGVDLRALAPETATRADCMGGDDDGCTRPFAALGLDPATGLSKKVQYAFVAR